MNIVEAIRSRKSVRGYKPDPVPREVLKEVLEIAIRSPSTMNTQPWEITVVSGQALEDIKQGNIEMSNSGAVPYAESPSKPFEGKYRQRQVDLAIELFRLMGIAREDKEKRTKWTQRGFRFFDAPVGIILSIDKSLAKSRFSLLDVGAIVQTICLAALNYGLATCVEYQAVMYPEVVRRFTGIPESKQIIIAIAIGYPDWHFPANRSESQREPVENITTWCGWD
jgi:nitroreductase